MLTHHDIITQWPEHKRIETYVYYDMPLLYSSFFSDRYDFPHWVLLTCTHLDLADSDPSRYKESWLAVRMSAERKDALTDNRFRLRDAITQAEDHYVFRITLINCDPVQVETLRPDQIDPEDLPDPGVTLHD